jgi:hypothetical protein
LTALQGEVKALVPVITKKQAEATKYKPPKKKKGEKKDEK